MIPATIKHKLLSDPATVESVKQLAIFYHGFKLSLEAIEENHPAAAEPIDRIKAALVDLLGAVQIEGVSAVDLIVGLDQLAIERN